MDARFGLQNPSDCQRTPSCTQTGVVSPLLLNVSATNKTCILLEDTNNFQLKTAALFSASPANLVNFKATGLPNWAQFNPKTSVISGTVARDASVFGQAQIVVSAEDSHANRVEQSLTLMPRNLAPIADCTFHDRKIVECDPVSIELQPLFYDPFMKEEIKIICVSGLPMGVEFDPQQICLCGSAAKSTSRREPYVITLQALRGHNKLVYQHFLLKIVDGQQTDAAFRLEQNKERASQDDNLNRISIDVVRHRNTLYLEFQNALNEERDGKVQKAVILGQGGSVLPDWMNSIRDEFVTAKPPPNHHSVDLELNVELGNGQRLVKPVRIDLT